MVFKNIELCCTSNYCKSYYRCRANSTAYIKNQTTPSGGLSFGVPSAIPRLSARCSLTPLAAWSAALCGRLKRRHCGVFFTRLRIAFILAKKESTHLGGFLFGVPGAIRTRGLSLRRRTLYPAELRRQIYDFLLPRKTHGKRDYTEARAGLSTKAETNSAQRAATCSRSGP